MAPRAARRTWGETARDLLSVHALIAALLGAVSAASITVHTTASQLRALVRSDSLERVQREADRQMLRTLVRVVCGSVVREEAERFKYDLDCAAARRIADDAGAAEASALLVLVPRSHRPPPLPPPALPGQPMPMLPAGRADAPRLLAAAP